MIRIMKYGEVADNEIFARAVPGTDVSGTVAAILRDVRENGDSALLAYTQKFDGVTPDSLAVTAEEMEEACSLVEPEFVRVMEEAAENIRVFHRRQVRNSFVINDQPGIMIGQKIIPVDKAGLYVPGGTAALSSTVLMCAIPAKIAGVPEDQAKEALRLAMHKLPCKCKIIAKEGLEECGVSDEN